MNNTTQELNKVSFTKWGLLSTVLPNISTQIPSLLHEFHNSSLGDT